MNLGRGAKQSSQVLESDDEPSITEWLADVNGNAVGERLVTLGLLSQDDLMAALDEARLDGTRSLARILVDGGRVSDGEIAGVLAEQHGLSLVDFRTVTPTSEAVALITETTVRTPVLIPIANAGEAGTGAVASPAEGGGCQKGYRTAETRTERRVGSEGRPSSSELWGR